ncbi:MAG: tRNA nucleotidyltransferase [Thiotrichales bacterium]|nr:tRNA nucleotidyltransferase [Thiotrichales bacterium]
MTSHETGAIVAALTAKGAVVRFVGGCVRDALLERSVKDIDIATPDPPERVLELLRVAGIKAIPTGIDHGTVTAVIPPAHYEITTLRVDAETYGRHARVEFSSDWESDAARRDFTINAIYCDPQGEIFDPTGGIADLERGIVRFVGTPDTRIKEDYLRILRFFRFTAFYGTQPADSDGLAACRENAEALTSLSGERVAGEMLRLLESDNSGAVLKLMEQNGILDHLLPELKRTDRLCGIIAVDGPDPDPLRRLAAANSADEDGTHALAQRLRLSKVERERLTAIVTHEGEVAVDTDARGRRRLLYRLGAQAFEDLAFLEWAANPSEARSWRRHLLFAARWSRPALPIGGADVMALGVPRGPEVGKTLEAVEAWWIKGDFKADREKCLVKLRQLVAIG